MRRRELLATLLAAGTFVSTAQTQPTERGRKIGVILDGSQQRAGLDGLRDGFGPRIDALEFMVRDAEGELAAVEAHARELEQAGAEVLVVFATTPTLAARRATASVPIVFTIGTDPVQVGLVETIAKPGGRLTGVNYSATELTAKRLEILREFMPRIRRVTTFYTPENPAAIASLEAAREAGRRLGVAVAARAVHSVAELRDTVAALRRDDGEAVFLVSDAMVSSQGRLIIDRALMLGLPTVASQSSVESVAAGALLGYGFSYRALGHRAASYVVRILDGAKAGELPVDTVSVPTLAVNLHTAATLAIDAPPGLMFRADEVIE